MNITDVLGMTARANETNTDTDTSTNTDTTATSTASNLNAGEEFDTFLTLLTAQIKNQDPLAPLDSTQFVEQLATFSGLELQATGNNFLEDIATMLAQQTYGTPSPETPETTSAEAPSTTL